MEEHDFKAALEFMSEWSPSHMHYNAIIAALELAIKSEPVLKEIQCIAKIADEQYARHFCYDTPGGIEHKEDAIDLIKSWADKINPPQLIK